MTPAHRNRDTNDPSHGPVDGPCLDHASEAGTDDFDRPIVDRKHIVNATRQGFSATYLTLLSIIQGVALASLALNAKEAIAPTGLWDPLEWTTISITFVVIVLVWYEYSWFVRLFVWPPSPFDAFIPFGLGATEVWATFRIEEPHGWMIAMGGLCIAGTVAYLNSLCHVRPELFGQMSRSLLKPWECMMLSLFRRRFFLAILLTAGIGGTLVGLGVKRFPGTDPAVALISVVAGLIIFTVVALVWSSEEAVQEVSSVLELTKRYDDLFWLRKPSHWLWHAVRWPSRGPCRKGG